MMKHVRLLVFTALLAGCIVGCSPEEPRQTEQPARQVQQVSSQETSQDLEDFKKAFPDAKVTKVYPVEQPAAQAHMVSLNTSSKKYHEPGCRFYDCRNCVTVTIDEADRQGGVPCKRCH